MSTQNRWKWKWSNGVGTSSQELGRYGKAVTPPQRKVAKNTLSGGIFKCVFKTYVQDSVWQSDNNTITMALAQHYN